MGQNWGGLRKLSVVWQNRGAINDRSEVFCQCFVDSWLDNAKKKKCTSGKSEGGLTVNVTLHLYLKVYLLLVRLQGTINHLRWNSQKFLFGLFTEFGMEWCWQEFSSPWTWQIECSCSLYKASIIHFLFSKKTYFPSCTYLFLCTLLVFVYVFFYNQSLLITSTSASQFLGENFRDFLVTQRCSGGNGLHGSVESYFGIGQFK